MRVLAMERGAVGAKLIEIGEEFDMPDQPDHTKESTCWFKRVQPNHKKQETKNDGKAYDE